MGFQLLVPTSTGANRRISATQITLWFGLEWVWALFFWMFEAQQMEEKQITGIIMYICMYKCTWQFFVPFLGWLSDPFKGYVTSN